VLSIFIGSLGWYTFEALGQTYWLNAIGGSGLNGEVLGYIPDDFSNTGTILWMVAGILSVVGGILCLTQGKAASVLGGVIAIGGCFVFFYIIPFATSFGVSAPEFNFDYFWPSDNAHIGYGWIITAAGGLIGLIGGFTGED